MLDLSLLLFILLLLQLFPLVTANATHNVTVGVEGSFFSPQTVSAAEGDVVNFIFAGDIHDITQSTPENPCSPLPGGFSSGFLGRGMDFTGPTVIFNLTVTDASVPIWYFCAATKPASHCNRQMVGVINPPSQAAFMSFANAALLATTTSFFNPPLVLSGQGAVATLTTLNDANSPPITPSILTSIPPSPLVPTSSASTTPTSSSSSGSNRAAIIGGAVAAAAAAFLLLCLGLFLWRRIRKQRRMSAASQFFAYNHPPDRGQRTFGLNSSGNPPTTAISTINYSSVHSPGMISTFDADRETQQLMSQQQPPPIRATKSTSPMMSEHHPPSDAGSPLQPLRNISHMTSSGQLSQTSGLGPMYNNNYSHHQNLPTIQQASSGFTNTEESNVTTRHRPAEASSSTGSDPGAPFDVKALAKEVVTLIRQEQTSAKDLDTPVDEHRREQVGSLRSAFDSLQSAPPRYHTVEDSREG